MTLPSSGPLRVSAILAEAHETGSFAIGRGSIRALANRASGVIKASDFYGKTSGPLSPLDSVLILSGMNAVSSCTDDTGNVYYAGSILTDAAIAKTDAQGNVLWAKRSVGGAFKDLCLHEGAIYAVGLDATARGIRDFAVVKFSTDGVVIGAKTIHAGSTSVSGGAYCVCSLGTGMGIAVGGAVSVVSTGSSVLLYIDSNLTVTKQITMPAYESIKKIKFRNSMLYVLDLFVGNGALANYIGRIRTFQPDGTHIRVFNYQTVNTTGCYMYDFDVDSLGNVYTVGSLDLNSNGSYGPLGVYTRHSSTGTSVYTRTFGYPGYGTCLSVLHCIAVDQTTGSILVTSGNSWLYELNSANSVVWSNTWGYGGGSPRLTIEGTSFVLRQTNATSTFSEFRAPLTGLKLGTHATYLYAANSKYMPSSTTVSSFSTFLTAALNPGTIATLQYLDPVITTTDLAISRTSYTPI